MGTAAMFPEKETRIIEKKTCKTIMILRVFSDIDAVVPNLLEYNREFTFQGHLSL